MSNAIGDTSVAKRNVQFMRDHLLAVQRLTNDAGGSTRMDLDVVNQEDTGSNHYTEDSVFYYCGTEYRGLSGIQEFIERSVGPNVNLIVEIVDLFGSEQGRVGLAIRERLKRLSDGATFDYMRNVIYKIENGIIVECWISDERPAELRAFLDQST